MTEGISRNRSAPWHIWVVGSLSLLWYASGAYTIITAQHATLPGLTVDEAAYYADKPMWLALVTDLGLIATIAGSIGLLLRRAWTVPVFGLASILVLGQNLYEIVVGTSRVYANMGAAIVTSIIMVIVVLTWRYSRAMRRRGVLS